MIGQFPEVALGVTGDPGPDGGSEQPSHPRPDAAGGYAGYSLFPANSSVLTVEFKINLMAPAKGEALVAAASVVKPGRTLTVCEIRVYAVSGGQRTLCATALQTLICLLDRDER